MKLRQKIVLATGLIILVAIVIQGSFNIFKTSSSVESVVSLQLQDELQGVEREIVSAKETIDITKMQSMKRTLL